MSYEKKALKKIIIQGKLEGKRGSGRGPIRYIDRLKDINSLSIAEISRGPRCMAPWSSHDVRQQKTTKVKRGEKQK